MKKLTALFLAGAMTFSLAACGGSGDGAKDTTAAPAQTEAQGEDTTTAAAGTEAAGTEAAGTEASASGEAGVVYGIYKAGDQTWFIDEGAAAQAAVEAKGDEFIFVDAKMSPEEYLKAIDNAIANKAKGIVTCIPDQTMS